MAAAGETDAAAFRLATTTGQEEMSTGTNLMHRVMLAVGRLPRVRIFRNNVGLAWVGNGRPITITGKPRSVTLQPGDVVLRGARPLHAGLIKGSGDNIGWVSRTIEPENVGETWAIFLSAESKDGAGRLEPDQQKWIDNVRNAGGIAGVVRCEQDMIDLVNSEPGNSGK